MKTPVKNIQRMRYCEFQGRLCFVIKVQLFFCSFCVILINLTFCGCRHDEILTRFNNKTVNLNLSKKNVYSTADIAARLMNFGVFIIFLVSLNISPTQLRSMRLCTKNYVSRV